MEISFPPLNVLVIAPEIVVLVTALLVMMTDLGLRKEQKSRLAWVSLAGVLMAAVVSYFIWDGSDPELHGMLAADGYALFLNLVILTAAALALLFSVDYAARTGLAQGEYYTLLLLSTAGMMLMAAAVNLMTIFLALEILSIALYVLVGLNREQPKSAEGAIKYLLLGAFASGFLLYGMALVYGQAGTTSLGGIQEYVASLGGEFPALLLVALGLLIVGFGFKVAAVPFQMWTPDVYEGAPTSVTAFMSVGAKVAGFAALGRLVMVTLGDLYAEWGPALAVLAALTMTVGNLAALRQMNLKRMLAYSSIAHAGYILVGAAAGQELGIGPILFYLFAYAFMNVGAFAVVIAVERLSSGERWGATLDDSAGLGARSPWLAVVMAGFMLSLAGIPPLVGFLGKLYVFTAAVKAGMIWLAVLGVVNSVISAYYYLRVVGMMFMKERPAGAAAESPVCPALQVGVGIALLATILWGVWPGPIMDLAQRAVVVLGGG